MEGNVRIAPHAIASVEEGFFPIIYASKNDEGYSQKSIRLKTPKLSSVVILSWLPITCQRTRIQPKRRPRARSCLPKNFRSIDVLNLKTSCSTYDIRNIYPRSPSSLPLQSITCICNVRRPFQHDQPS